MRNLNWSSLLVGGILTRVLKVWLSCLFVMCSEVLKRESIVELQVLITTKAAITVDE